jgi:hypothetical protein
MLAINHTLTAVVLAVSIEKPAIVLPLALISHFLIDIIPHYGNGTNIVRGTNLYDIKVVIDGLLSIVVTVLAMQHWPNKAPIILAAVFFSVLPDLLWPLALIVRRKGVVWEFFKFHKLIQHESPKGIFTEIAWAACFGTVCLVI